jgi:DNA topoisomerase-1
MTGESLKHAGWRRGVRDGGTARTGCVVKKSLADDLELVTDPTESAQEAGLRYVNDSKPGITRKRRGNEFQYLCPDGHPLTDHNELIRVKRLGIPPAWIDVWICPVPNGHLQATGRDARGRKQYRYHSRWREVRDATKYDRMIAFGEALPAIRRRVARDIKQAGLPRTKVLATVVRLLETTLIRVGNDEYAKENKSYGLTTMRNRHVKLRGPRMSFEFRGKGGKRHTIDVHDPYLAKIVRRCRDLPGQEIFGYVDEEGNPQDVTSGDVNDYLREVTGQEFTAKDFRTWAGTKLAAIALQEFEKFRSPREAKRNIKAAVEAVAKMLGNTPAICRKCYVHPAVMEAYLGGTLAETLRQRARAKLASSLHKLKPEEAAVMMLIHDRLTERKAA